MNTTILRMLGNVENPLRQDANELPSDFQTLKAQIINLELADEINALTAIFQEEDYLERFKTLCQVRADRNNDTCLDLFAPPFGPCNQLYFDIATGLGANTMGEVLEMLKPDLKWALIVDVKINTKGRLKTEHATITLRKEAVSAMTESADSSEFGHFIAINGYLFDIRQIEKFDFNLHRIFYEELQRVYPDVAARLYQHNSALNKLQNQLVLMSGKGQSPQQAIQSFIEELRRNGERVTGQSYTSDSAILACDYFLGYLESLPADAKEALLALQASKGTLQEIISRVHLCVETAANDLQAILDNVANQKTLTSYPHVSQQTLAKLRREYSKRSFVLPTLGEEHSIALPGLYLERTLRKIEIIGADDYILLLSSFPAELYRTILSHATILCDPELPVALITRINEHALAIEQEKALYDAIISVSDKLGGDFAVIHFAMQCHSDLLLKRLLEERTSEERVALLKEKNLQGSTVLYCMARQFPHHLSATLQFISEAYRLDVLLEKNDDYNTVLELMVETPDSFCEILLSLPYYQDFCNKQFTPVQFESIARFAEGEEKLKTIVDHYDTFTSLGLTPTGITHLINCYESVEPLEYFFKFKDTLVFLKLSADEIVTLSTHQPHNLITWLQEHDELPPEDIARQVATEQAALRQASPVSPITSGTQQASVSEIMGHVGIFPRSVRKRPLEAEDEVRDEEPDRKRRRTDEDVAAGSSGSEENLFASFQSLFELLNDDPDSTQRYNSGPESDADDDESYAYGV